MGFPLPFPFRFRGAKVFVSPPEPGAGTQGGSGTFGDPYHSVAAGIRAARGGGKVYLLGGHYVESVAVSNISGKWWKKIVVQPFENERVTIDSLIPDFLHPTKHAYWESVGGDEYVWTEALPEGDVVSGGAFMDRDVHTRLVRYDRLEDLQSGNDLWPTTGENTVWEQHRNPQNVIIYEITKLHRPWVYMGPGIWFDTDHRKVHIRLSPTHNNIDGLADYSDGTDPNQIRLALSEQDDHALFLRDCSHMMFKNLTFRFGGQDTIRIRNCSRLEFDHVNIRAASRAIRFQNKGDIASERNTFVVFRHCEIDGGLPSWFFRSDRKDTYFFDPANSPTAPTEDIRLNNLGRSTSGVLISGGIRTSRITVHHCEIFNGHDVYVFGDRMSFHHNWVHGVNDDGIAISGEAGAGSAKIYQNVITRCLTMPSFGADGLLGHTYMYRNLIDLRTPIAGIRPAYVGDPRSMRNGHFYKGDEVEEGAFDLFHNTCVVLNPGGEGDEDLTRGFAHYSGRLEAGGARRAYNNIFVAAYTGKTKELAFLPPGTFAGPTDGNTYFRISAGPVNADPVPATFLVRTPGPGDASFTRFANLGLYRAAYWQNNPDEAYERKGRLEDPKLQSFDPERPHQSDDLRLKPNSPAGASLPLDLLLMDFVIRDLFHLATRGRGCYRFPNDRLRVGVDGRKVFPPS